MCRMYPRVVYTRTQARASARAHTHTHTRARARTHTHTVCTHHARVESIAAQPSAGAHGASSTCPAAGQAVSERSNHVVKYWSTGLVNPAINGGVDQPAKQLVNQLVNQPVNQPVNLAVVLVVNQLVNPTTTSKQVRQGRAVTKRSHLRAPPAVARICGANACKGVSQRARARLYAYTRACAHACVCTQIARARRSAVRAGAILARTHTPGARAPLRASPARTEGLRARTPMCISV